MSDFTINTGNTFSSNVNAEYSGGISAEEPSTTDGLAPQYELESASQGNEFVFNSGSFEPTEDPTLEHANLQKIRDAMDALDDVMGTQIPYHQPWQPKQ